MNNSGISSVSSTVLPAADAFQLALAVRALPLVLAQIVDHAAPLQRLGQSLPAMVLRLRSGRRRLLLNVAVLFGADAEAGKVLYTKKCKACHGVDGSPPAALLKANPV